jgi:hypothetical protein
MVKALEVEMSTFLNQYLETYTTFDADQIAGWYCVSTITMRADGSINCVQCRGDCAILPKGG